MLTQGPFGGPLHSIRLTGPGRSPADGRPSGAAPHRVEQLVLAPFELGDAIEQVLAVALHRRGVAVGVTRLRRIVEAVRHQGPRRQIIGFGADLIELLVGDREVLAEGDQPFSHPAQPSLLEPSHGFESTRRSTSTPRSRGYVARMNQPMSGVRGFSETFVTPLIRKWKLILVLGIAIAVVGILLLANLADAAFTLALLVGLGLLIEGVDEVMQAARHEERWPAYVLGAIWIVGGIIAVVWPGITLWALAAVTGVTFIVGGLALVLFAGRYRRVLPHWAVWLLAGAVTVVFGILCLAWPGATVVALAVLLGLRVLVRGLSTIWFALGLRQLEATTSPRIPT